MTMSKERAKPSLDVKFRIERGRLANVAGGLLSGDISGCLTGDVRHTAELLVHVVMLEDLAPGFMDEMFALFIPHFIKLANKAKIGEMAQQKANEAGLGDEWRAVVKAGNHPKQKDYIAEMVAMHMKANGVNQAQAIRALAAQMGRDEDSLRRIVTRSKKRGKT